jgi:hypothetical protein
MRLHCQRANCAAQARPSCELRRPRLHARAVICQAASAATKKTGVLSADCVHQVVLARVSMLYLTTPCCAVFTALQTSNPLQSTQISSERQPLRCTRASSWAARRRRLLRMKAKKRQSPLGYEQWQFRFASCGKESRSSLR